jgi:hypothetical protein
MVTWWWIDSGEARHNGCAANLEEAEGCRIGSTSDWIGAAARASSRRWRGEAARGSGGGSLAAMALGAVRVNLTVALFYEPGGVEWTSGRWATLRRCWVSPPSLPCY